MPKSALGRGLGALLGNTPPAQPVRQQAPVPPSAASSVPANPPAEAVQDVPFERIHPSALQPRKEFAEGSLNELADSIRAQGILQPLIVRRQGNDFELIAGERRWRAAQLAGLKTVPVIVREADDHNVLELMLIENLQREGLNPIEEAMGYQQLIAEFALKQEDVAVKVGKNRATVANSLRLLNLPAEIQNSLKQGEITTGHAKALLSLPTADQQIKASKDIIRQGLNVRRTEQLVNEWLKAPSLQPSNPVPPISDPHVHDLQNKLRQKLGTKVQLKYHKGKGNITIHFFSDDDLVRLLELISVNLD